MRCNIRQQFVWLKYSPRNVHYMHTLQLGHNDHGPLTNFLWTFLKIHLLMPIEVPNYQLLVVPIKVPNDQKNIPTPRSIWTNLCGLSLV